MMEFSEIKNQILIHLKKQKKKQQGLGGPNQKKKKKLKFRNLFPNDL